MLLFSLYLRCDWKSCTCIAYIYIHRVSQNSGTYRNTQHPAAGGHRRVLYRFGVRGFALEILTVDY